MMITKVDPKQTYTATDISREGLIPWARDPRTIARILASGVIKTEMTGESTQKRYTVKGSELQEYIKKYGPVLQHTVRKPKQQYVSKKNSDKNDHKKGR